MQYFYVTITHIYMRIIILTLQLTLKLLTNFFLFVQFVFEPFPLKYCVNHKCYIIIGFLNYKHVVFHLMYLVFLEYGKLS